MSSSDQPKIGEAEEPSAQIQQITTAEGEEAAADSSQIAPIEDLKKLFSRVKDSLLKSSTSVEALQEAQNLVSILSAQVIAQATPLSEEQSKFFYDQFFKEIGSRAANSEIKNGPSQDAVADLMRSLVDLLAAELKMKTDNVCSLITSLKPVFACSSKFHKSFFQKIITDQDQGGSAPNDSGTDVLTGSVPISQFNEDERKWRLSLDNGTDIDVFKRDLKRKSEMWSKGTIISVQGTDRNDLTKKKLTVKFIQDVGMGETKLGADSSFIAPYGTMSAFQHWRDSIKKFDEIDAQNVDGEWHNAVVEWIDDRSTDNKMMMVRVRYPHNNKDEYIGVHTVRIQKYNSQTVLKDVPGNAVAIDTEVLEVLEKNQPSTTVIDSWQRTKKQDEKDMLMIETEGQVIVAVERNDCLSQLLVELIVRFSEAQGFESLLEVIASQQTSLKSVNDLVSLVNDCSILFHKTFVDQYFERLSQTVETKLLSADDKQLRAATFQLIEDTVDMIWIKLMSRKVANAERQIGKYQLLTKLGILFLKQKFLQKRVDGAAAIDMVCKRALSQKTSILNDTVKNEHAHVLPTLLRTLQETDAIDLFFNRATIHEAPVKRSGGILALYLSLDALSEEKIDFIWRNCSEDSIYRSLISGLSELSTQVQPGQLTSIIERICLTQKNKIKSDEIELLQSLCYDSTCSKLDDNKRINQNRVLEFFWDYLNATNADDYLNKQLTNKTIFCFMDILKSNSEEIVEHYFQKIQEKVKSGKSTFVSMKIAYRYFKERKVTDKATIHLLADKLEERHELMQLIIEELSRYSKFANKKVAEDIKAAEVAEKAFDDSKLHEKMYESCFTHQEQMTERIEFLTLFAQECSKTISKDQLAQLWNVLVDQNQIKFDKKQVFLMLKNFVTIAMAGESDNRVIALEDLCAFYRECIAQGLTDFSNLDLEGAICLISFFILINSQQGRLKLLRDDKNGPKTSASKGILKKSGELVTSISSNKGAVAQNLTFAKQNDITGAAQPTETGNSAITGGVSTQTAATKPATTSDTSQLVDKDGHVNFIMCLPPSEVEGAASLWRIATQAFDYKVHEAATNLLLQIHTNHEEEDLKLRISEFEDQFINSCVNYLEENLQIISNRTPEQKAAAQKATLEKDIQVHKIQEKRIMRTMRCLKRLIQNSESEGTFGLVCHKSFAEGEVISGLEIENAFNYEANMGFQKSFKLKVKNNLNFWQLKKIICKNLAFKPIEKIQEVPPHPSAIRLVVKRYTEREIKGYENGLLLSDPVLNLKAGDKIIVSQRSNESLSNLPLLEPDVHKFTPLVKEAVRNLWDKFCTTDADSSLQYMNTAAVQRLIDSVSTKTELQPRQLMAYNTNEDGEKLLFPDFLSYYEQNATVNAELVRTNLMYVGLRADLQNIPKPGDPDDILNLRTSPEQMPRYKIGNEQRCFRALLACMDHDFDTKKEANDVLLQACTNQRILQRVLDVDPNMFDWEDVVEGEEAKEVVYTLTFIQQLLLNNYDDEESINSVGMDSARTDQIKTWVTRFLKSGGLNKLMVLLEKVINQLKQAKEVKAESTVIVKQVLVLSTLMQILRIFVTTTVCCIKKDINADTFSIKSTASALSKRLTQGPITAISSNKYLRRADAAEDDLEDMLDKSCVYKSPLVTFLTGAVASVNNKSKPTTSASKPATSTSATKQNAGDSVDYITEEYIFGNDVVVGCDLPPNFQRGQKADETKTDPTEESNPQSADQQMSLKRETSKDDKSPEKERINLIEVTDQTKQLAEYIQKAMLDTDFDISIDFQRLRDLCLDGLATFIQNMMKDVSNEKVFIQEACHVWSACSIHLGNEDLNWERKPEQIEKNSKIQNFSNLIIQFFSHLTADIRRFFMQSISLVCEKLSKETSIKPFQYVINQLVNHLNTVTVDEMKNINDEMYELLGDFVLQQYHIERQDKQHGRPEQIVQQSFRDIFKALVGAIKRHNSFLNDQNNEALRLALALESLLITTADVFSFLNKRESYEQVMELLREENLIEYIFYEVLFFVPGKTQCPTRNKARRVQARKAGYQLLFKVLKYLRPEDISSFLSDSFEPLIDVIKRPSSWDHKPSDRVRGQSEFLGIRNLGNVCYMISMLQQFYWVPAFRYGLLKVLDDSDPKMVDYKERMIDDNMLRQLQKLFGMLEMSERDQVDPTEFCFSFKQWNGQPTNIGEQRDAQEFLNEFFDKLENLLKDSSQKHLLQDIFQGSQMSQKKCSGCNHVTHQEETFYTQTLYVENSADVYESLQKQLEGDIIQEYKCEVCNQSVNLHRRNFQGKLPNVLILHLQRIAFDYTTLEQKKLSNRFEFPLILELQKYACKGNIELTEEERADPKNAHLLELLNYQDNDFVYRLVGICIHRGRANSGHYWSLIHVNRGAKEPDPKESEETWYDLSKDWKEFNDERATFFSSRSIPEQAFGGYMSDTEAKVYIGSGDIEDWSKSAYLLVYEKKLKSELRQVVKQPEGHDDTIECVKFNAMPKEIPSWLEQFIINDNRSHIADGQVFHSLFFNFASSLLKHITAELLDQEEEYEPDKSHIFQNLKKITMQSGQKLTFDLLSHASNQVDPMKSICSSVRSVFSFSDPTSEFGTKDHPSLLVNFIKTVLHDDKCEYLFKIMWEGNASREVRDNIGITIEEILSKAIKVLHKCKEDPARKDLPIVGELHTLVVEVMHILIDVLKNRLFQQKWGRLVEFFEILEGVGTDNSFQTEFFLGPDISKDGEDDIVTKLCDFMLQQKSPKAALEDTPRIEMGGSYSKPKFGPLVALASHLVRCQWTEHSDEAQPTFKKQYDSDKRVYLEENLVSKRFNIPAETIEFFTNKELFYQIMSCDYSVTLYAKGIAHLCYRNADLSRKICQYAIECRYEGSGPNYLKVLRQMLKLDDTDPVTGESLQAKRLEWVFGTPQPKFIDSTSDEAMPQQRHNSSINTGIQVGLDSFGYKIDTQAYEYVTALNYDDLDENYSVLQIILRSYFISDVMRSRANEAMKLGDSKKDQYEKLIVDDTDKMKPEIEKSNKSIEAIEATQSTPVAEQLRSQGMPEETIREMLAMMTAGAINAALPNQRPRANSDSAKDKPSTAVPAAKSSDAAPSTFQITSNTNLQPLEWLMHIIMTNERTMTFFANLPPFTYQHERFTDWIQEFIEELKEVAEKGKGDQTLSKDQKESIETLSDLLHKKKPTESGLKPFLESLDKKCTNAESEESPSAGASDDVIMIDTQKQQNKNSNQNSPSMPIPYMIVKALGTTDSGLNVESNGLHLVVDRLACKYVQSKPTGASNDGASASFLAKFSGSIESNNDNAEISSTVAIVDEQGGAAGTGSSGGTKNYTEPNLISDLKVDLDDPAVQYALEQMSRDDMYTWIFEMHEYEKIQALENFVKEQVFDHVKRYYKDKAPAGEAQPAASEPAKEIIETATEDEVKEVQPDDNDPIKAWEGEPLKECDDLLYVFTVSNVTDDPIRFKILFKEALKDCKINLVWPREGLVGNAAPRETGKVIAILPKATATSQNDETGLNEIQKLTVTLVAEVNESKLKGATGQGDASGQGMVNQGTNESKIGVSIGVGAESETEKQCSACTMWNAITAVSCFICQTKFQDITP